MKEVINYINENKLGKVLENKQFKDLTTIKIGGRIRLVYYPNSIENFIRFYSFYKNLTYPLFIIGEGSNILAADKDFFGVVVSFKELDSKYFLIGNTCIAYPGCSVVKLAYDFAKLGYTKIEFYAGIPATIGGAIYMNAGANGYETKDLVKSVKLLDKDGKIVELTNEDLKFSYRKSLLQENNYIILESTLILEKESNKGAALDKIKELKDLRKRTQPIRAHSAGCTFQNPIGISAWELIDKVGLRGYSVNDAQVSKKHSNFLINKGNASSLDMITLINTIKEKVKEQFNIELKCEWILVNFD